MRFLRFQYSLQTLLIILTMMCVLCGWYGRRVSQHLSREELIREINSVGGSITVEGNSGWPTFYTERISLVQIPYTEFHRFEPERLNALSGFDVRRLPGKLPDGKPEYSGMWKGTRPGDKWPAGDVTLMNDTHLK